MQLLRALQRGQFSLLAGRLRMFHGHLDMKLGTEQGMEIVPSEKDTDPLFVRNVELGCFSCIYLIL